MKNRSLERQRTYDVVEPVGPRILIRKDDDRHETRGGIALPDNLSIPVLTARVIAISKEVEADEKRPIRQYDKVLVNPQNAIPVDFENDKLWILPAEDVLAVLRRSEQG
jgi:chaperonin GroES